MVEEPSRKPNRRICNRVKGLWPASHLLEARQAVGQQKVDPLERATFVGREARRRRVTWQSLQDFRRSGGRKVDMDAEQFRGRLHALLLGDECAPVAALGDEA